MHCLTIKGCFHIYLAERGKFVCVHFKSELKLYEMILCHHK